MNERPRTARRERAKKGWATRRKESTCSSCGRSAKLYEVQPVHPARDLCIDCAWRLCGG